ncbi:hypothetical protein NLI96_g4489 [Meripilus lineatus]|uniref:F-box domain-containing protein n=1 Tax=Meripilus lineatus TaxID=2056292 RepID=A0AAD5VA32_9APHY|nr:hypothetical protein NLI96_g4489 [Physisporinus lineatus]
MHAALRIDEVFLRIVEALDQDTAPSTLSILARTCRAFHEPATDVLWSTQISLGPILRLIPGLEIYVERKSQLRPAYDDLLADLLPAQPSFDHFLFRIGSEGFGSDDLALFDKYAAKIKRIRTPRAWPEIGWGRYRLYRFYTIQVPVLAALHAVRPISCFPQLRYLRWPILELEFHGDEKPYEHFISMFFGPNLSELHLHTEISPLLQYTLKEACPSLESFKFTFIPYYGYLGFFQGWARLKSLEFTGVWNHADTWSVPALLPNLESLTLCIDQSEELGLRGRREERDRTLVHIYPSLRSFDLTVKRGVTSQVSALLTLLSCPRLEDLEIRFPWERVAIEQPAMSLFQSISHMCSPGALQKLKITTSIPSRVQDLFAPFEAIRPLLFFPIIHTLHCEIPFVDLDDAKILEITQAWRSLVSLHLESKQPDDHTPAVDHITLKALEHLSKNCPNLKGFYATVDARSIPELPSPTSTNPETDDLAERCKLASLSFVDSSIDDPESCLLRTCFLCFLH